MPPKNSSKKGKAQPAQAPLTAEEKQYIKDHMDDKTCLRCDDPCHTAMKCSITFFKGSFGWYAKLSIEKRSSADRFIEELRKAKNMGAEVPVTEEVGLMYSFSIF